jgi:hypothetical protein
MLDAATIDRIAQRAAEKSLRSGAVERVISEDTIDSAGHGAIRIVIVLTPNVARTLGGDAALDALSAIQAQLSEAGEERLPIIEYATDEDLKNSGDAES